MISRVNVLKIILYEKTKCYLSNPILLSFLDMRRNNEKEAV